jgi:hypothetical protein
MDYITLAETLAGMVDDGYLEESKDNNNTRFAITGEGQSILEYFSRQIPASVRGTISNYVKEKRSDIKKDYMKTAVYFYNADTNDFTVKCGVYEEERALLEIFLAVDTREQARLIQTNWKANFNTLYGKIIEVMITSPSG